MAPVPEPRVATLSVSNAVFDVTLKPLSPERFSVLVLVSVANTLPPTGKPRALKATFGEVINNGVPAAAISVEAALTETETEVSETICAPPLRVIAAPEVFSVMPPPPVPVRKSPLTSTPPPETEMAPPVPLPVGVVLTVPVVSKPDAERFTVPPPIAPPVRMPPTVASIAPLPALTETRPPLVTIPLPTRLILPAE